MIASLGHSESHGQSGIPASRLQRIAHSKLSRSLIACFSALTFCVTLCVVSLIYDVKMAEQNAEKSLRYLEHTQELATLMRRARAGWSEAKHALQGKAGELENYRRTFRSVSKEVEKFELKLQSEGLDSTSIHRVKNSLTDLNNYFIPLIEANIGRKPNEEEISKYIEMVCEVFKELVNAIQYLQDKSKLVSPHFIFGIPPQALLLLSGGINLLVLALTAVYVERKITSPIIRLTHDCSFLEKCQIMPKSKATRNDEIEDLSEHMHHLSVDLNQAENGRRNYLEMLKTVQSQSLSHVQSLLLVFQNVEATPRQKNMLSMFSRNLNSMQRLVASMAEELNSGNEELNPQYGNVDCRQLMEACASAVGSLVQNRKIQLTVQCESEYCEMDEQLITRVLCNFLSNAIKYSPEQGEITFSAATRDNSVRFSVKDCGPGISSTDAAKLFKKFSQLEAADGVKRPGTGLGLAICKRIIEAHGGDVGCVSELGKGSEFWASVPQRRAEPVSNETTNAKANVDGKGAIRGNQSSAAAFLAGTMPGSIKKSFLYMLVSFLVIQFLISVVLTWRMNEVAEKTSKCELQKKLLFTTQTALGKHEIWNLSMNRVVAKGDFKALEANNDLLKEQIARMKWLRRHAEKRSVLKQKIESILETYEASLKSTSFASKNSDQISTVYLALVGAPLFRRVAVLDSEIFRCLELEKTDLDASFRWAAQLRNDLLVALLLSGAVNLFFLGFTMLKALGITERIAQLQSKTRDLVSGKELLPSVQGKDELAFLDLRICLASQSIKQAESQRQELMACINHDLRTPANSVLSGLELFGMGVHGQLSEEKTAALTDASNELLELVGQINDFLLIEKIDSGTLQTEKNELDLGLLIEDAVESLQKLQESKNLKLEENIPAECRTLTLGGDQALLSMLFKAIVKNAMEASASDGTLKLSVSTNENSSVVEVCNQGEIIPADSLKTIFERFRFREGKPLTGLGLPLAYRICKLSQAQICIESNPELGTKVSLKFPHMAALVDAAR